MTLAINSIMFSFSCRSFGVNDKSNCKGQHRQRGWQQKGNVCCLKLIPEGIRLGGDTNEIAVYAQNVMIHINTELAHSLPESTNPFEYDFNAAEFVRDETLMLLIRRFVRCEKQLSFTTYSHQSFAAILGRSRCSLR